MAQIHELIGKAMGEIGAIGKDSKNSQQGFMYRGIDAVYNALNPVMAKYGLFICPEIVDQKREERTTKTGAVLTYTLLTIKYTVYAPDGSNITLTVVGEGMDSGDKSTNKAMSVAMKYAMFQLFFIPTEELKDPDADVYTDIRPKAVPAEVSQVNRLPPVPREETPEVSHVKRYLIAQLTAMRDMRGVTNSENNRIFKKQLEALVKAGLAPDKKVDDYSIEEAEALIDAMNKCFEPTGTELKTE